MEKKTTKTVIIMILFWIAATIISVFSLLATSSASSNQIFLNLSASRLVILFYLFLVILLLAFACLQLLINKKFPERLIIFINRRGFIKEGRAFSLILFINLTFWIVSLFSPSFFNEKAELVFRLKPLLIHFSVSITIITLIMLTIYDYRILSTLPKRLILKFRNQKYSLLILLVFLMLWAVVGVTEIGLIPDLFWDLAGVPILFSQVIIAIITAYFFWCFLNHTKKYEKANNPRTTIIFTGIFIWIVAIVVWLYIPQPTSKFNPGPFLPNNQFYPNSDALSYDLCAQHALMGNGYCGEGHYASKPFYSFLLLLFHMVVGQNTNNLLILQTILFSIFPVILFLIGREIQGYLTGVLLSFLSIFKVHNSIAAALTIWKVSHPRMMMSEFLLGILLSGIVLCLIRFFRTHQKWYLLAATGISSLATMVRHNAWILFPLMILTVLYYWVSNKRIKLSYVLLVTFFFFMILTPWMVRNISVGQPPLVIVEGIKNVIWENRYKPDISAGAGKLPAELTLHLDEITRADITEDPDNDAVLQPELSGITMPANNSVFELKDIQKLLGYVSAHFFHTMVGSIYTLPTGINIDTLDNTILNQSPISPWSYDWRGEISIFTGVLIFINLFIISMGIGYSLKKIGAAALLPAIVFIFYDMATSVARTSGGRYLVPIDWIVLVYYSAGLVAIIWGLYSAWDQRGEGVLEIDSETDQLLPVQNSRKKEALTIYLFLLLGVIVALPEFVIPERNIALKPTEKLVVPVNSEVQFLERQDEQIEDFLASPDSVIMTGKALYPRILIQGDDNYKEFFSSYPAEPYGLIFSVFNEGTGANVYMPLNTKEILFGDAQEVTVVGCKHEGRLTAISITLHDADEYLVNPYAQDLNCDLFSSE